MSERNSGCSNTHSASLPGRGMRGHGTRTLAMAFWSFSSEIDYAAAAPYALLMVVFSLPLTWLLYVQSKRTAGR